MPGEADEVVEFRRIQPDTRSRVELQVVGQKVDQSTIDETRVRAVAVVQREAVRFDVGTQPLGERVPFCLTMAERAGAGAGDVLCFGHTHVPWSREINGVHFVNTGSVGRPKGGDWRADFVVINLTMDEPAVEFVRVEYDLDQAAEAIRRSGLPDEFAAYLAAGGGATTELDPQ